MFSLCVLLPLLATPPHHISLSATPPASGCKTVAFIKTVPNPSEKTGQLYCGSNAESRKALRQHNREQIKQHQNGFLRRSRQVTDAGRRWRRQPFLKQRPSTQHHRSGDLPPEQQLGKPYVWGGTRPDQGFAVAGWFFMPTTRSSRRSSRAGQ